MENSKTDQLQLPSSAIDQLKENNNDLVFSYLTLRNLIGFTGLLLPWVLSVFPQTATPCHGFQPSISDYYFTDRGEIFVVMLCILGVFLLTYKGYNNVERALTIAAAISALGVAFIPTGNQYATLYSVHTGIGGLFRNHLKYLHLPLAGIFLLCLAIMSIVYFPKTNEISLRKTDGKLKQKGKRNIVYFICGWTIVVCVLLSGIYIPLREKLNIEHIPGVFIFETIAVEAFAISWLTKGETLWPDGEHYLAKMTRRKK